MLPPRTRLDPEGFYALLGLDPTAKPEAIIAAFRRQARVLHPDVPVTGDTKAFVAVRQAYDVLSDRQRRARYDQAAQRAEAPPSDQERANLDAAGLGPDWLGAHLDRHGQAYSPASRLIRRPRFSDVPIPVWIGLGGFLVLGVLEIGLHLHGPPPAVSAGIRPNAAPVAPLPPGAQRVQLYGPSPVQLAGSANFYVVPATGAAVLWRKEPGRDSYIPVGQLPPFSSVQAVSLLRQTGMVEVLFSDTATGFIEAKRLAPGDADAARRAYCGYNAGPSPSDGELLQGRSQGGGTIQLENRGVQPAVVKLRDSDGLVALSVFLGPGGHVGLAHVPAGTFRADFAIGELWSRACNGFAAGMRARRMVESVTTEGDSRLVVPPEQDAAATDISDQDFEQDR